MMKFIHVAVAVLSLLSIGQSAPVMNCERLTQPIPINNREQLLGRWTYIAEATNIPASKLLTKMFVDSARMNITASANKSDGLTVVQSQKMFGSCFSLTSRFTLGNGTLNVDHPFTASVVALNTSCPDCFVFYSNYTIGGSTYRVIQLSSRRNKVTDAELEEFTRQVKCVNLPSAAILDPEKGFCADESSSQETEVIDLTNVMDNMGSEVAAFFDTIMSSDDGLQKLIKMLSSGIAGLSKN